MAAAIDAELGLSTTPDGIQYNAETGEIIEHSAERKLPTAAAKYLDKAERLARCAAWAEFERLPEGQGLRLHDASFCRVRLCPMCQWRRSLKLGAQVRRVVERANADHIQETGTPWRWLMVTFTVQNVPGPQLGQRLTVYTRQSITSPSAPGGERLSVGGLGLPRSPTTPTKKPLL